MPNNQQPTIPRTYSLDSHSTPPLLVEFPLLPINPANIRKLYNPYTRAITPASPAEYADYLANDYCLTTHVIRQALLLRTAAIDSPTLMPAMHRWLKSPLNANNPSKFIEEFLKVESPSTGYCPLSITCSACGSHFRVLRSALTTITTPPLYCIFCGSPSITTSLLSDEEVAYQALADHYHVPLSLLKDLFHVWTSTNTHYTNFQAFMEFALTSIANKHKASVNEPTTTVSESGGAVSVA